MTKAFLVTTESTRKLYTDKGLEDRANNRSIKRQQTPEDLVGAVMFLCSNGSEFITGQVLNVDGGTNMH